MLLKSDLFSKKMSKEDIPLYIENDSDEAIAAILPEKSRKKNLEWKRQKKVYISEKSSTCLISWKYQKPKSKGVNI